MRLIIFGPPGAGKGTQANLISQKYGVEHISTGDVLREAVKNETDIGKEAKKYMERGELVPDSVVIEIIRQKISSLSNGSFMLDGFPRTLAQAEALDKMLEGQGMSLDVVIMLDVDDSEIIKRIMGRREIEGRSDDTEEVVRNRLAVYREQTAPLEDYYRSKGKLVKIDGKGTIEEVFQRIDDVLKQFV